MTAAPRTRAARMAPDQRREAIIAAVCPLLEQHGASVTTRQIAEAAGIAEGTIFRVFSDKHELLMAAARATLDPEVGQAEVTDALSDASDLESTVRILVAVLERRMRRIVAVMTALHAVMQQEGRSLHEGPPEFLEKSRNDLTKRLAQRFAPYADELRVTPEVAARLLRSITFGNFSPMTPDEDRLSSDEIVSVLLDGVRAPDKENP